MAGSVAATSLGVELLRYSLHAGDAALPPPWILAAFVADPRPVRAAFRAAQATMIARQNAGLAVAVPGTNATTRHERRLLRATAAAQSGDEATLDNLLFKVAPHPGARPVLVRAVVLLASGLAASGQRLCCGLIPGPALPVARWRGLDLGVEAVAWHGSGTAPAPEHRR